MNAIFAMFLFLTPPVCGEWSEGFRSSEEERKDARERVRETCRSLGATKQTCKVMDAMVVRESSGDSCAIHTMGPDEYGRGVLGLSVRWHRRKWQEDATGEEFHIPEISAIVAMRIYRRAVKRHGATTWTHVNDVFAGRFGAKDRDEHKQALFCNRLEKWGVDCESDPRGQLGKRLGIEPDDDQWIMLEEMNDG